MKPRRSVLRSVALVVGTGAGVGLAGCTIEVGDPDATPPEPGRSPTPGGAGRDGGTDGRSDGRPPDGDGASGADGTPAVDLASIRAAFGDLIREMCRAVEDEETTLNDVEPRQKLETISDRIDEAREDAGSEGRDQLRLLRKLSRVLETLVESTERLRDASEAVEAAMNGFEAESYGEALDRVQTAKEGLDGADRRTDRARNRFEEIEGSVGDFEEIDPTDVRVILDKFDEATARLTRLADPMECLIRGSRRFESALERYESEAWAEAEQLLSEAKSLFDEANRQFQDFEGDTPEGLRDTLERYVCIAGARGEAARYYVTAANAASEERWDAVEEAQANAEAALEQCE